MGTTVDTFFTHPPVDAADYGQFAAAVAVDTQTESPTGNCGMSRTYLRSSAYLIDNNPARYTQLVTAAYPAIKAIPTDSTVVLAGFSPLVGEYSPPPSSSRCTPRA